MSEFVDEAMRLAATARRESEWGFPDAPVVWDELRVHLEAREALLKQMAESLQDAANLLDEGGSLVGLNAQVEASIASALAAYKESQK